MLIYNACIIVDIQTEITTRFSLKGSTTDTSDPRNKFGSPKHDVRLTKTSRHEIVQSLDSICMKAPFPEQAYL